ncbi:MAG: hypothetical protein WCA19_25225 [Candidatus Acidiferrales bacterium]
MKGEKQEAATDNSENNPAQQGINREFDKGLAIRPNKPKKIECKIMSGNAATNEAHTQEKHNDVVEVHQSNEYG